MILISIPPLLLSVLGSVQDQQSACGEAGKVKVCFSNGLSAKVAASLWITLFPDLSGMEHSSQLSLHQCMRPEISLGETSWLKIHAKIREEGQD